MLQTRGGGGVGQTGSAEGERPPDDLEGREHRAPEDCAFDRHAERGLHRHPLEQGSRFRVEGFGCRVAYWTLAPSPPRARFEESGYGCWVEYFSQGCHPEP